jgi:hypothetical protein
VYVDRVTTDTHGEFITRIWAEGPYEEPFLLEPILSPTLGTGPAYHDLINFEFIP